jgi:hypothetical protein
LPIVCASSFSGTVNEHCATDLVLFFLLRHFTTNDWTSD